MAEDREGNGTTPKWRRRTARIVAGLSTLTVLLIGLTNLFDWAEKKVEDPRPTTIAPDLVSAELQPQRETLGDYLSHIGQSPEGVPPEERSQEGLVFAISVRLQGGEGEEMPLRWQMYESSGRRVPGEEYRQTPIGFKPENQDHSRTVSLWVPYPPKPGRYFVQFALLDARNEPHDELNTKTFELSEIPRLT